MQPDSLLRLSPDLQAGIASAAFVTASAVQRSYLGQQLLHSEVPPLTQAVTTRGTAANTPSPPPAAVAAAPSSAPAATERVELPRAAAVSTSTSAEGRGKASTTSCARQCRRFRGVDGQHGNRARAAATGYAAAAGSG